MIDTRLFTVNTFARLTHTTRDILHHYDKIGLLSPILRGKNNYRYYSIEQLATINLIHTLQELGMTLAEIKQKKDKRTPQFTDEVLVSQISIIDKKIDDLVRSRKLLLTLQKMIRSALYVDEQAIIVKHLPAEAIILGGLNDYSEGKNDYDALFNFYEAIGLEYPDLDLNYPVWGMFSGKRIRQGDWRWPDRYYFYNPDGYDKRPAGLYVIGYLRGGYGQGGELYQRLLEYIDKHNLEICGNAYEEYPLNELCAANECNYLIRIMIHVKKIV